MFESADDGVDARSALRQLVSPSPVWIRVARILPTPDPRWGRTAPPWKRAGGVDAGDIVRGELLAWVADSAGSWVALVRTTVRSRNGRLRIDLPCHLVPADAVIPAQPGERSMTHAGFDKELQRRLLGKYRK